MKLTSLRLYLLYRLHVQRLFISPRHSENIGCRKEKKFFIRWKDSRDGCIFRRMRAESTCRVRRYRIERQDEPRGNWRNRKSRGIVCGSFFNFLRFSCIRRRSWMQTCPHPLWFTVSTVDSNYSFPPVEFLCGNRVLPSDTIIRIGVYSLSREITLGIVVSMLF